MHLLAECPQGSPRSPYSDHTLRVALRRTVSTSGKCSGSPVSTLGPSESQPQSETAAQKLKRPETHATDSESIRVEPASGTGIVAGAMAMGLPPAAGERVVSPGKVRIGGLAESRFWERSCLGSSHATLVQREGCESLKRTINSSLPQILHVPSSNTACRERSSSRVACRDSSRVQSISLAAQSPHIPGRNNDRARRSRSATSDNITWGARDGRRHRVGPGQ